MNYHIRVRACALIIENQNILLVEFSDEKGVHYNLPAGGVEPNESIIEAVQREAMEEATVEVEVGPLAFAYEYAPHINLSAYGNTHTLGLMFECKIKEGSIPKMPENPDENQTNVVWIPLSELKDIKLYPNITGHIFNYIHNKRNIELIEEQKLEKY
ncbi:NUDIX domain-containing protein [Lederbergia panacisoli]|uniref:NUDIX domain-containing protein n=1 Tax=Lederbergia panacisoli TaxID=1255251 RepID=UPI00214C3C99|nr:NUDIX domain-containing protein [Lederbergia panacisoli]MCR2821275.1 NUDIX domain-containing protein [Lederbergia panacisoli]